MTLFSCSVLADNCDYFEYEDYVEEEIRYYLEGELLQGILKIEDTKISGENVDFKVYNPFDFEVEANIDYVFSSKWFGNRPRGVLGLIPPKEYSVVRGDYHNDARTSLGDVTLSTIRPEGLKKKLQKVTKQKEICMNCDITEIFCEEKNSCTTINTVPLDVKPECGLYQECKSQYIDNETGLCEKSQSKIKEEATKRLEFWIYSIIGFVSLVIIGRIAIKYLENEALRKKIESEAKKIESKEFNLNVLKKQISKIRKHKKLKKREIIRLNNLKSERAKLIEDIEEQYKQITKPFFDRQVLRKVKIVPEVKGDYYTWQGYKCFFKEGRGLHEYTFKDLVHRWVWRKHNGRWPRGGFHIHHRDHNKLNNDARNLEEISRPDHSEKHKHH